MSRRGPRTPSRRAMRWAAAAAALASATGLGGASCLAPNELILVVNTSMTPGEDIDNIEIKVNGESTPYVLDPAKDGSILLPATLGFLPPDGDPYAPFTIEVIAYKGTTKRVSVGPFSLQVGDFGPVYFPVDLPYLCADDACEDGETCVNGSCVTKACGGGKTCTGEEFCLSGICQTLTLPPQTYPAEGLFADELCFNVPLCFDSYVALAPVDPTWCTIPVPSGRDMNVAVVTAPRALGERAAGVCNNNVCLAPLDDIPSPENGEIQLPFGVCYQMLKGRVLGVTAAPVTEECPKKTILTAINGPASSIASCSSAPVAEPVSVWVDGGNILTPRIKHTETLIPYSNGDFEVLVTGGFEPIGPNNPDLKVLASTEHLMSGSQTWATSPNMTEPRAGHTATWIPSARKVLVAGGTEDNSTSKISAEVYTFGTGPNQMSGATPVTMTQGRFGHAATLLVSSQSVLLTGGIDNGNDVLETTELFDSGSDSFSMAPPAMLFERALHTATRLLDDRVLVVGGAQTKSGGVFQDFVAESEIFNQSLGGFSSAPPLAPARILHTATLLAKHNGVVIVAGGMQEGFAPLGDVHFFDPANMTWTCAARSMNVPRFGHTATELDNGRVLVLGGISALGTSAPAELFEPGEPNIEDGTWTIVSVPQGVPRAGHTVTHLPGTSTVLLAGGGSIDHTKGVVDFGAYETLLKGEESTLTFTDTGGLDVSPATPKDGCGETGEGGSGGGAPPEAPPPVDFNGSGFADSPGVARGDGCGVAPSAPLSRLSPWAILLLGLAARRRRRT